MSAWVPMTIPAAPDAASSSAVLRLAAGKEAVRRLIRRCPIRCLELTRPPERAEHRLDRPGVLRGEHFGRGQQGCLPSCVHDLKHRAQGHDGLARADLPLQQSLHRVIARQLGGQLGPNRLLALGEPERQPGVERVQQASGRAGPGRRRVRGRRHSALGENKLDRHRLVPRQPATGREPFVAAVRLVDRPQRPVKGEQAAAAHNLVRQWVGNPVEQLEDEIDGAGDLPGSDVLRRRVDGYEGGGELVGNRDVDFAAQDLILGMR